MPKARKDPCIFCSKSVKPRQEGLQCDNCGHWQHRTCNTGISREDYRRDVREHKLHWTCEECNSNIPTEAEVADFLASHPNFEVVEATEPPPTEHQEQVDDPAIAQPETDKPHEESALDSSFDVSQHSFVAPDRVEDRTLDDVADIEDMGDANMPEEEEPEFEVLQTGTKQGKPKLVDSRGFGYTVKRCRGSTTYWWCSIRNNKMRCPATVIQSGETFIIGQHEHTHPSEPGLVAKSKLSVQVKDKAKENIFQPAAAIVEEALLELPDDAFDLPDPGLLTRAANRLRSKLRPSEPSDLDFEIDHSFLPESFLRRDFMVGRARHLLFATDHQLHLLSSCKRWYIDGTFAIIKAPFTQLMSIHGFLKYENNIKQVPLAFCFMSRRRKKDYKKLLQEILEILPVQPDVEEFVVDFEDAIPATQTHDHARQASEDMGGVRSWLI